MSSYILSKDSELLMQYRSLICKAHADSNLPGALRKLRKGLSERNEQYEIGAAIAIDVFNKQEYKDGQSEAYSLIKYCADKTDNPSICLIASMLCSKSEHYTQAEKYAQKGLRKIQQSGNVALEAFRNLDKRLSQIKKHAMCNKLRRFFFQKPIPMQNSNPVTLEIGLLYDDSADSSQLSQSQNTAQVTFAY